MLQDPSSALASDSAALSPVETTKESTEVGTTSPSSDLPTTEVNKDLMSSTPRNGHGVSTAGMLNDPYSMGAMGGMYGPGMYGMGGMGMMGGMYGMGGMGMMGGMYGMTPEAQKAQVMMFTMSRIVELWGVLTQVIQSTFGSAADFVCSYNNINQTMTHMESECLEQEKAYEANERARIASLNEIKPGFRDAHSKCTQKKKKNCVQKVSLYRKIFLIILRHCILIYLSMLVAKGLPKFLSAFRR